MKSESDGCGIIRRRHVLAHRYGKGVHYVNFHRAVAVVVSQRMHAST